MHMSYGLLLHCACIHGGLNECMHSVFTFVKLNTTVIFWRQTTSTSPQAYFLALKSGKHNILTHRTYAAMLCVFTWSVHTQVFSKMLPEAIASSRMLAH